MMVEDIHKWTNGRYTLMFDEHTFFVRDNEREKRMTALEVTRKLNEQKAIIDSLKDRKMGEGQYLYVVRQGKEIVALFPNKQKAIYYCQEQLANLHYQKERWMRVNTKSDLDLVNEVENLKKQNNELHQLIIYLMKRENGEYDS